jgi:hypothetical protein
MGIFEYLRLIVDTRLWKWLDRNISHLWKLYKAIMVMSSRAGYTRMAA